MVWLSDWLFGKSQHNGKKFTSGDPFGLLHIDAALKEERQAIVSMLTYLRNLVVDSQQQKKIADDSYATFEKLHAKFVQSARRQPVNKTELRTLFDDMRKIQFSLNNNTAFFAQVALMSNKWEKIKSMHEEYMRLQGTRNERLLLAGKEPEGYENLVYVDRPYYNNQVFGDIDWQGSIENKMGFAQYVAGLHDRVRTVLDGDWHKYYDYLVDESLTKKAA